MKLVLVRPNTPSRNPIPPPLGLMYISAAAKKAGHDVVIHDSWLRDESPYEASVTAMRDSPSILGIQVFSDTVAWTRTFIDAVTSHWPSYPKYVFKVKIIIGGPYVTAVGSEAIKETGADIAMMGEFENIRETTLKNIVTLASMKDYKLKTYKTGLTDINEIPIPDWDSINLPDYWPHMQCVTQPTKGKRIAVIQRTRGCNSNCTFCGAGGKKIRTRVDKNVLEEIQMLKARWGINEIWFNDDNFISNYTRSIVLLQKIATHFPGLHIRLPLGIRTENIDINMVYAMQQAGVYFTGIGIESGSPRVLDRVKKRINLDNVRRAISLLNGFKITTVGFFILGLPTETREEMEDTVRYAMSTKLNHAQFGTFIPYPGSEDYNEKSPYTPDELVDVQINATERFYLRPRILWGLLKNLKLSQIKAFWQHRWVKNWLGIM